jgi:hypothetical protein
MVPAGSIGSAAIQGLYYRPEWDIMIACHGDDFLSWRKVFQRSQRREADQGIENLEDQVLNW